MKSFALTALLLVAAGATGCMNFSGWQTVHGTGHVVTETRAVSGFDQVSVAGAGELRLIQGDEESLTIETDDNLLPLIRSDVSGGHLYIGPRNVNLRPTRNVLYHLKLKHLSKLDLSGSLRAEADTIRTEHLGLSLSGSGRMTVAHLDAQALTAAISGSGSTAVAGRAGTQKISISGSGDHHASELQCAKAEANISGSGNAALWVTDALTAHISGSGAVTYRGNASVDSHVSGSGRVRHQAGAD